jgi:hypothetical protein
MDDPEMMKAADRASARYSGNAAKNAVFEDGYKAGWKARASAEDGMLTEAEVEEVAKSIEPIAFDWAHFKAHADCRTRPGDFDRGKERAREKARAAHAALSRIRSGARSS